ncbi:hypothetical protein [Kribbella amoyensis]|uniref:hypothetical protein n=1 Tax=Kribbella amoyensis TaxID=996641 RepID=UPI001EE22BEE|nr:hypothetical protein [Kribbella amoyensis]
MHQAPTREHPDHGVRTREDGETQRSPTAPASTHGTRRPKREAVRSEAAPKTGFATTETAAPTPVTTPKTNSLLLGATASDCCASSTWIGPSQAAKTPTLASTTAVVHRPRTRVVGSARAGCALTRPQDRLLAITSRNHPYDAFGVRRWVA